MFVTTEFKKANLWEIITGKAVYLPHYNMKITDKRKGHWWVIKQKFR